MANRHIRRTLGTAAAALGLTLCLTGCGYPNRGSRLDRMGAAMGLAPDTAAFDPPKLRLGVMPFDAWYSPWEAIDADALGQHRHEGEGLLGTPLGSPRGAEVSRGVMYTESGGFLDIAHLRNAVDLTLFVHRQVSPWLREDGEVVLQLLAAEPDLYRLTLTPPPGATAAERDEAAVEIAGRVAYLMTTWHEVLTWFGYRGLGVITERPSAFSYDDAPSHRVGVELAMAVLREVAPEPTLAAEPGQLEVEDAVFDAAVTTALPAQLHALGVVSPDEATRRMRGLEGHWWADGRPILRVVDLGLDGSPLRALVTPELALLDRPSVLLAQASDGPEGVVWDFDETLTIAGVPLADWFSVTIEPRTFEAGAIRRAAGVGTDAVIDPRADFPRLEESILAMPVP